MSGERQSVSRDRHAKPVVVVSQCLGFAAVRYNGVMLQDHFVQALRSHVQFIQVCPEVGIGLGVPRDPIRIVSDREHRRLVQPSTSLDMTDRMIQFSDEFLDRLGPVDGFILKSRSPSCGIKDVKVFTEGGDPMPKGSGFFAESVLEKFPMAAIEDEGRLTNLRLRHHFLVKLYAHARFRAVREAQTVPGLIRFHTSYKLQFMAYSQTGLKRLGQLVANATKKSIQDVLASYGSELGGLMALAPRPSNTRNALLHAFGYVSQRLNSPERTHFLDMVDQYRHERLPIIALLTLLESWVMRFEQPYLQGQTFFEPYPRALMSLVDSAKGAPSSL